MKKYITNLYGHSVKSTAMNVQHMVTSLAVQQGYIEMSISARNLGQDTESDIDRCIEEQLAPFEKEDLVVVQLPTWNGIAYDERLLKILRSRVNKLVVFVHDFVPLMFINNFYLFDRYLEAYNLSDLVILPSSKMKRVLREKGLKQPIIIQEIWDCVSDLDVSTLPDFQRKIKFAGSISRFPFIKSWGTDIPLELFGDGEVNATGNVEVKGWSPEGELVSELSKGGFGLVWSENIENQNEREYSSMNTSFKFSTYLAAGLPILVNKGIAKQKFVEEHNIGYAFDTIEDVADFVKGVTKEEYEIKQAAVHRLSRLLREGFFTKKLLLQIEEFLYL